jgi:hypothetical protein
MACTAKPLFVLRTVQNTKSKASAIYNFLMLSLVVSKETARLQKVN